MSELAHDPEAKTPFEASVEDFYAMLANDSASPTHISVATGELLDRSTEDTFNRERRIEGWATRYHYDSEGILANGAETNEDIMLTQRVGLVCDVTAFLVASEHSMLSDRQKADLLKRADNYLDANGLADVEEDLLGTAIAPYIAHTIDMAELAGVPDPARWQSGRFVLDIMGKQNLLPKHLRKTYTRSLRAATRM
jgi:hypothetical protein